ncbi:MAG: hypothetical protein ISP01_09140 [Methanobrevibacter arboriphilus]|uniref:Adhesin-like protein n=1 Tax=Methanobrevibacter arboriphilus TaxID=39441 RepID=A0A843AFS5_METAZ|nr:hypothetical protein [Methanobrevibacter arboriphilus]MBF4469554.1 hypothetical protein [Methanobrevibacter arboriphilus]
MIIMKNINKFLIHSILIALTLLLLFVSLNANFAIDNTTSGGIKDAISNVNSGDTIFLDSGIYTGDNNTKIGINKSITLQGNGSVDTVIIDAQKNGRIFTINSNNITFINITFFNGSVTGNNGGAISNTNFANITFINCKFINNTATSNGGAIYNSGNNFAVINCTFTNNEANGGGAFFTSGDNSTIINSTFINNTAGVNAGAISYGSVDNFKIINSIFINNTARETGGAIVGMHTHVSTIINCTFTNNSVTNNYSSISGQYAAGAIYAFDNNLLTIINSTFNNNSATRGNLGWFYGGAIYIIGTVSAENNLTIINTNFTNNTALVGGAIESYFVVGVNKNNMNIFNSSFTNNKALISDGGAIRTGSGNLTISNSNFINNTAENGDGGAIWIGSSNLTISNSNFINNTATNGGGAIINSGGNLRIDYSTFTNNNATNGGAIINIGGNSRINASTFTSNNASTYGGAIYNSNCNISVNDSIFTNNNASYGGAIGKTYGNLSISVSVFNINYASYGGAIINSGGNSRIDDSTFTSNNASYGGAIYNYNNVNLSSITGSSFVNNTAVNYGGVIYNTAVNRSSICDSSFTSNKAIQGGAIQNTGVNQSNITNSNFNNNTANYGGAIITSGGNSSITNSNFIDNVANNSGGAIYSFGGANMGVISSNFTNNNASYGGGIYNDGIMNVANNTMFGNFASVLGNVIYNKGSLGVLNLSYLNNQTIKVSNNTFVDIFATLTDDMNNPITGLNITFYLNSTLISVLEVIEGYLNVSYFVDFEKGTIIPITGDYLGIGTFNINILNGELLIVSITNSTINASDVNIGEEITINGQLTDYMGNGSDSLTVNVDGNLYNVTIDSTGFWSLNYATNSTGNITIVIDYLGNDNYSSFTNNTIFEVFKNNTNSTIDVLGDFKVGENITIGGSLSDENGNLIGNVQITVTIDGKAFNVTTNSNGTWKLLYTPLNDGDFLVLVKWTGNENYTGFINNTSFNVTKLASKSTINTPKTVKVNQTVSISGLLTDQNNNPIKNANLELIIDNELYNLVTDSSGNWILNYTPKKSGIFNLSLIYQGDNHYYGFVENETFNVSKLATNSTINIPTHVKVGETIKINGKAYDENDNPLANVQITVTLDGKDYYFKTDSNGFWSLKYKPTHTGKNNIKVTFNGNEIYLGFVNNSSFNVKNNNNNTNNTNNTNKTNNTNNTENINSSGNLVYSSMKKTGIPIIAVILILISIFTVIFTRKRN